MRLADLAASSELIDEIFGRLLEGFSAARRRSVRAMLRDVVDDQALMLQLEALWGDVTLSHGRPSAR